MNEMPQRMHILRNLKDAGCDERTIQTYFELESAGRNKEQYRLLSAHRVSLLEQVHVSQHMIDCLDYLLYTMKEEKQ